MNVCDLEGREWCGWLTSRTAKSKAVLGRRRRDACLEGTHIISYMPGACLTCIRRASREKGVRVLHPSRVATTLTDQRQHDTLFCAFLLFPSPLLCLPRPSSSKLNSVFHFTSSVRRGFLHPLHTILDHSHVIDSIQSPSMSSCRCLSPPLSSCDVKHHDEHNLLSHSVQ